MATEMAQAHDDDEQQQEQGGPFEKNAVGDDDDGSGGVAGHHTLQSPSSRSMPLYTLGPRNNNSISSSSSSVGACISGDTSFNSDRRIQDIGSRLYDLESKMDRTQSDVATLMGLTQEIVKQNRQLLFLAHHNHPSDEPEAYDQKMLSSSQEQSSRTI
jgi:hypothetical protein